MVGAIGEISNTPCQGGCLSQCLGSLGGLPTDLIQGVLFNLPILDLKCLATTCCNSYGKLVVQVIELRDYRPYKELARFLLESHRNQLTEDQVEKLGELVEEPFPLLPNSLISIDTKYILLEALKNALLKVLVGCPDDMLQKLLKNSKTPPLLKDIYPLIQVMQISKAVDEAMLLRDVQERNLALFELVDKPVDMGLFSLAIEITDKISKDGWAQHSALKYIARKSGLAGKFKLTIKVMDKIEGHDWWKNGIYDNMAIVASKAGKFKLARKLVGKIISDEWKNDLLKRVERFEQFWIVFHNSLEQKS